MVKMCFSYSVSGNPEPCRLPIDCFKKKKKKKKKTLKPEKVIHIEFFTVPELVSDR
jgi:hypothetical protein